jgi:hypothetical protein
MHPGTPFDIYPLTLKGTDERTDTIMGVRDTGIRPGINFTTTKDILVQLIMGSVVVKSVPVHSPSPTTSCYYLTPCHYGRH